MKHLTSFRAFALSPLFLVACESQEMKSLIERQDYFNRQIAIYEERVQKAEEKLEAEKEEMEEISKRAEPALKSIASKEGMLAEMGDLINSLAAMENSMLEKVGLIESYKKIFQPRTVPNETSLGDLTLPNGTVYRGVIVKESTATHFNIAHSGGFAKVPYVELPDSIRARIVVAPVESITIPDPKEVIARKPASIKSAAELAEDRKRAQDEFLKARQDEAAQRELERSETMRKEEEKQKAYTEKVEAYSREMRVLDEQITKLRLEINTLETKKADLEYANNFGTVRLAKADFIKKTQPIDDEIKELTGQMSALQSKKTSLVPPLK